MKWDIESAQHQYNTGLSNSVDLYNAFLMYPRGK